MCEKMWGWILSNSNRVGLTWLRAQSGWRLPRSIAHRRRRVVGKLGGSLVHLIEEFFFPSSSKRRMRRGHSRVAQMTTVCAYLVEYLNSSENAWIWMRPVWRWKQYERLKPVLSCRSWVQSISLTSWRDFAMTGWPLWGDFPVVLIKMIRIYDIIGHDLIVTRNNILLEKLKQCKILKKCFRK